MDNVMKQIIKNSIAQTEQVMAEAITKRKAKYRTEVAEPKIAELKTKNDALIAELKSKLEREIQNELDMQDFIATAEVNTEYKDTYEKLKSLLPNDEEEAK